VVGGGGRAVVEPIGRDAHDRTRMAVSRESGRAALSVVHTLATDGRLSLCAVRIGTGRTHQIRVHLRHLRAAVLGDATYGDPTWNRRLRRSAPRPLLHAYELRVPHPSATAAGEEPDALFVVRAPLPTDLARLGARLAGCDEGTLEAWLQPRVEAALNRSAADFERLSAVHR